jgi:hypothetical protein
VIQVLVEQTDRDALERASDRGDLGEDVDAIRVVVDHPLEAADLALDPPQSRPYRLLHLWRTLHAFPPGSIPPWGIVTRRSSTRVISKFVKPGTTNDTPYNRYALLCSMEEAFGLGVLRP